MNMRIWYNSHALLTVSEAINKILFDLIGNKTKVELRWDPTMEHITIKGEIQYKFKIGNQFFITTHPVAIFSIDVMVGHGTQVYKV
ncbi:hypothetical protein JVT61DRAFT_6265 [Boletus reticuloceps]|uniref:Uncharacterized protein n=1 Tax=Boletus reticuloceps TaxID=495285 RepID=A0A8I3A8M1_9AGAM|nr:hypothetical protein JVT61DRAFT_6265 [Boletus reticuloceps]